MGSQVPTVPRYLNGISPVQRTIAVTSPALKAGKQDLKERVRAGLYSNLRLPSLTPKLLHVAQLPCDVGAPTVFSPERLFAKNPYVALLSEEEKGDLKKRWATKRALSPIIFPRGVKEIKEPLFKQELSTSEVKLVCHTESTFNLVKFDISQAGSKTMVVNQLRTEGVELSNGRLMLIRIKEKQHGVGGALQLVKAVTFIKQESASLQVDFVDKGSYFLFIDMDWHETTLEYAQLKVSCLGRGQTKFIGDHSRKFTKEQVLKKVFSSLVSEESDLYDTKSYTEYLAPNVKKYQSKHPIGGYHFKIFSNKQDGAIFHFRHEYIDA